MDKNIRSTDRAVLLMKTGTVILWILFLLGQTLNAGNMNYQQEQGREEINPIYGKHPSKERIYITKAVETGCIFAASKMWPEYENKLLIASNTVVWTFIIYDTQYKGIAFKVSF